MNAFVLDPVYAFLDLVAHGIGHGVKKIGPVDGDDRHPVLDFIQYLLVFRHGPSYL